MDRRALMDLGADMPRARLRQVTGLTDAQLAEIFAASRPSTLASEVLRVAVRRAMTDDRPHEPH